MRARVVYRDEDAKKEWLAHVKRTPLSMVPVLINGQVPAYQSAMGTNFTGSKILRWFEPFPKRYWPKWALEELRRNAAPPYSRHHDGVGENYL